MFNVVYLCRITQCMDLWTFCLRLIFHYRFAQCEVMQREMYISLLYNSERFVNIKIVVLLKYGNTLSETTQVIIEVRHLLQKHIY